MSSVPSTGVPDCYRYLLDSFAATLRYNKRMRHLRKVAYVLDRTVLRIVLFAIATAVPLVLVFGTPDALKGSLEKSGIYNFEPEDILQREQQQPGASLGMNEELSISDPVVKKAFSEALPVQRVQQITEEAIDGTYAWLRGDTQTPDFIIDLSQEEQMFIEAIADGAVERVNGLPDCSIAQLQALNEINPFTVDCKPPVSTEEVRRQVSSDLEQQNLIEDTVITGEEALTEIKRYDSVGLVQGLPTIFQLKELMPLLFVAMTVLSAGIVLLSETKRKGTRSLGFLYLGMGIFTAIITGVGLLLVRGIASPQGGEGEFLEESVKEVVQDLVPQVANWAFVIAVIYIIAGVLLLQFAHHFRRKKNLGAPTDSNSPAENLLSDKPQSSE